MKPTKIVMNCKCKCKLILNFWRSIRYFPEEKNYGTIQLILKPLELPNWLLKPYTSKHCITFYCCLASYEIYSLIQLCIKTIASFKPELSSTLFLPFASFTVTHLHKQTYKLNFVFLFLQPVWSRVSMIWAAGVIRHREPWMPRWWQQETWPTKSVQESVQ